MLKVVVCLFLIVLLVQPSVQKSSKKVCKQKKDAGPCKGSFPRYFYNKQTGKCETFTYGGCGGNKNNFTSLTKCEKKCVKRKVCKQKKDVGPCKGSFERYFYNKKTGKCEKFIYGGCGGNGNNFGTLAGCKKTCVKRQG